MTTNEAPAAPAEALPAHTSIDDALLMCFSTPLMNLVWPDSERLNAELRALIVDEARRGAGLTRSNVGGWHSDLEFLQRDLPCARELAQRVERVINELTRRVARPQAAPQRIRFDVESWANVLGPGGYHSLHNHPNAFWSGVYYVTDNEAVDDHPLSGKLELVDPRPGASLRYADLTNLYGRFLLSPRAGQMIVFPSWLQHFVHPYFGGAERISVAFNVSILAMEGAPG
jgi:uncharacterized protein (TIGR02466 family)